MTRLAEPRFLGLLGAVVTIAVGCGDVVTSKPPAFAADRSARPIAENRSDAPAPQPARGSGDVRQAAHNEPLWRKASTPATIPPVLLSQQHSELCRVKVGDRMPDLELPQLTGGTAKLASLYGDAATVVVFWKSNRRMSHDELADLGPDVVQPFSQEGVAVVGIAVEEPVSRVRDVIRSTGANVPQLLDADGKGFAQVGADRLPWTLVLDPSGKIVWFDLEYSHATRRELQQALLALTR